MYKSNGVSCRFDTHFIRFCLLSLCFIVCDKISYDAQG